MNGSYRNTTVGRSFGAMISAGLFAVGAAAWLSGCTVHQVYLKPGYADNEQKRLKRIVVVVRSSRESRAAEAGPRRAEVPPAAGVVVGAVANEFVSVQRDYILYPLAKTAPGARTADALCKANPKVNGVLFLEVLRASSSAGKLDLEVSAALEDCLPPQPVVWKAVARSTYASQDKDLATVIESYVNRISPDVRPYAAPAYQLVRVLLGELPNPVLSEDEKLEKIEVME